MAWNDAGVVVYSDAHYRLTLLPGSVYVAELDCHMTASIVEDINERIWSEPSWSQPWGYLMVLSDATTYDTGLRHYGTPPLEKRAEAMVIATSKPIYRMVISSIALGLRLSHNFNLSAASSLREGLARLRERLDAASRTTG